MINVMVVDDEKVIADTLSAILRSCGYKATAFYDGLSALDACATCAPDMVISDVSMPGLNGVEMAIQIRNSYPSCKILLFSGHASTADVLQSAKQRGYCFEVLTKPVHPRDLLAAIRGGNPKEPHPASEPAERQDFQAA